MRLELHGRGGERRTVDVNGAVEVGRDCPGIHVDDPSVSRRHLGLEVVNDALLVTDLGSSNGTFVNGVAITEPTHARLGDVIRIGDTELRLGERKRVRSTARESQSDDEFASIENDAVIVRFRPGTPGAEAASGIAAAARRARRRLAGFGSEAGSQRPELLVLDPFADPRHPDDTITAGTVVEPDLHRIWMVATDESPPEPPARALALLFGASLPASTELEAMIEGYGLWVGGSPDPIESLRALDLPPLAAAEGELRGAMALSFVHHLVAKDGSQAISRFLVSAQPGRLDEAARDAFGLGLTALELAWRERVEQGDAKMRPSRFVRLSLRYLRPHRGRQIEIFGLMLLSLAFNMVFPFVSRDLFDNAIPSGQMSRVFGSLSLLGVAFAISLVAGLRRADQSAYVSAAVVRDLRCELFARLQRLPASWYQRHPQGDVLARMFNDVGQVEQGLTRAISEGVFQALSIVVASVVMLTLNPVLGVVVLLGAPAVAFVFRAMGKGAQKRSIAAQAEASSVLTVAAENYGAEPVVKLFGLAGREEGRFRGASERLFRAQRKLARFGVLFGLSVNTVVTLIRVAVLGVGSWLILEGDFTVGGLVAFLSVMGEVLSPVASLTSLGQELQQSSGALARVEEVLDEEPEPGSDGASGTTLAPLAIEIHLDGIGFGYTSERQALRGIDVRIPARSKVAFVGPSGSGKSTILRLMMRLHDPDDGAVRIDGVDVRERTNESLRAQLGVVFQDTFLFDTTIKENILLGHPGATDAELAAAAAAAEVDGFVGSMPRGYETVVGERGSMLSGGQRQRVAIARALLRDPKILLLDEATSALDPQTERQIAATLDRVGASRTTVAITHRLTSVTNYDKLFVVADGRVVEQGTHTELVELGGVYARLWAEQTGTAGPAEAPFDVTAALARVVLFADLDQGALASIAARLQPLLLGPGDLFAEGDGQLALLARGRGRVLVPSLGTERTVAADLGAGDSFGVRALLGQTSGAELEAVGSLQLLVLDDEALTAIAAAHPSVGSILRGGRPSVIVPEGGARLSRMSFVGVAAGAKA